MIKEKYLKYGLYGLLSFIILCIIILSCVPPVSRDALIHHLAVPKLYLQHGGMHEIPTIKFSYYPMTLELLYMLPLYFGNDIIPKWIHFLFALGTAWMIYRYLKKKINVLYGLFGVLLFLSTPIIVKLSITAYVDLGLVFFSTASLILILKWAEEDCKLKYLAYSAICCGLALGTKYNGLVVFFLLSLFVPIIYLRENNGIDNRQNNTIETQSKAIGYGLIFILAVLILFSPWMIRNFVWKKNPIYPLYHHAISVKEKIDVEPASRINILSSTKNHLLQNRRNRWNHFIIRRIIYQESWVQVLLIPIRIFFQGEDGNPKYFDGKLNPLLFILPFFVFICRKEEGVYLKKDTYLFITFSITFIVFSFILRDMRIRYVAPALPLLVILSTFGLKRMYSLITGVRSAHNSRFLKYFAYLFVVLFMLLNLKYLIEQFSYVKPFDYICGKLTREEYITKFRPEYRVFQYANKNLPKESKILGVFLGNRRYYIDRNVFFDDQLISESIKAKHSPSILLDKLKNRSISHIIIWQTFFIQWVKKNYDKEEISALQTFFKQNTDILFSSDGYTLFKILYEKNNVSQFTSKSINQ